MHKIQKKNVEKTYKMSYLNYENQLQNKLIQIKTICGV